MTEREFRRKYPHATESTIKRNQHLFEAPRSSYESESLDKRQMEKASDKGELAKRYRVKHVGVVFKANHGIELDEDNRRFIVKPLLDALVSMGLAESDKEIKTDVHQRLD